MVIFFFIYRGGVYVADIKQICDSIMYIQQKYTAVDNNVLKYIEIVSVGQLQEKKEKNLIHTMCEWKKNQAAAYIHDRCIR